MVFKGTVANASLISHRSMSAALADNRFEKSLIPVLDGEGNLALEHEDFPRPDTTAEGLGALAPAFEAMGAYAPDGGETFDEMALRVYPQAKAIKHVHHAGNSSGIVDGAGAVLVASESYAKEHMLKPRARVKAMASVGSEPVIMLTAPGPAHRPPWPQRLEPARNPMEVKDVEDVVTGCVSQAGDQGACISRNAVLLARWPQEVPGVTLNRFCGSGLQGINFAIMGVQAGAQQLVVGGGVESMSHQPIGSDGGGLTGNNPDLHELYPMVPQGISADLIATLEDFSRGDLDRFAMESQQKAAAALADNRFEKSLIPVLDGEGNLALEHEDFPRPDTTAEGLGALAPAFEAMGAYAPDGGETFDEMALRVYPQAKAIKHVHHAGNSSGIVDGAGAVLVASESYAKEHMLKPRARVKAMASVGSEPVIMLTAPGPASRRALQKAGMEVADIDLWEINEAFATVPLKTMRDLEIAPERVNVNGGSIALGHPIGATGAILVGTALDELERRDKETALITMCIGGGMGIATIIERI